MDSNPYAAPLAADAPPLLSDSDVRESIRKQHLSHEASVKSIGTLYLLGFIFLLLGGIGQIFAALAGSGTDRTAMGWILAIALLVLAAVQFWLGQGLRKLKRGARGVAAVFAGIGLIGFPIGTIISAYILYLLLSEKGKMVFSPEYQEIIAATPHIRYKTSIVVWIILGIFLLLIVLGLAAAFLSAARR
jgi:hypothetical protein